jgi:glutaredoxin
MRFGWLAIVIALLYVPAAQAQFKWVDSGGRIGYGDKPPPDAHDIESLSGYVKGARGDPVSQLPFQLQRTMKDFPVTLYTMSDCAPCDTGRSLLKARAIPFAERTIRSADDVQALKKLTGTDQLPLVQIGSRIVTGFSRTAWDEALDLAGYARANPWPADWVWAAPTPLTDAKPAQAAATQDAAPPTSGSSQ